MSADLTLKPMRAVVMLVLLFVSVNGIAADPPLESFDRMFALQPGPGGKVTGADRDADPLTHAFVVRLRQGARTTSPANPDPIADSFARMLAHTPNTATPPVPSDVGPGPLIAAMVEPLRRSPSGSTAAAYFSRARNAPAEH